MLYRSEDNPRSGRLSECFSRRSFFNSLTLLSTIPHTSRLPKEAVTKLSSTHVVVLISYVHCFGPRHTALVIVLPHALSFISPGTFLFILCSPAGWSSGYDDVSNIVGTSYRMSSKKSSMYSQCQPYMGTFAQSKMDTPCWIGLFRRTVDCLILTETSWELSKMKELP